MRLLLQTLFTPRKAAELIKSNPRWLGAFLILSVVSTVCYALVYPNLVQATLDHLPPTAIEADKQVVIETLQRELPAKLGFFPIRLFIGWSTFSLALMYVCKAFAPLDPVRFRQALSLEVHSEATSVLSHMAAMVAVLLNANANPSDAPLSLAGLIGHHQDFVVNSLLRSLNIFTLWQVIILTVGVSIVCGFGKIKSLCIVLIVWSLSTMFNLGALKLLQDELHLLL